MKSMHDRAILAEVGVVPPARAARVDTNVRAALEADVMAIEPSAWTVDGVRLSGIRAGWYEEDDCPYEVVGRVGVVCVDGALSQRGGWWYDGYDAIKVRFLAALKDERVGAVALKFNSPGGVCAGCFEAVSWMRAAKAAYGKPVFAYADEMAYSAAYALACVADEIWLPESGGVGSVGVIGTMMDATKMLEDMGLRIALITSGKQKGDGHPAKALTDEIIERRRETVMHLAALFADVVATARAMKPAQVMGLEAACFDGSKAKTAGLADGVSSLGDFLKRCEARAVKTSARGRTSATPGATQLRGVLQSRGGHITRLR